MDEHLRSFKIHLTLVPHQLEKYLGTCENEPNGFYSSGSIERQNNLSHIQL